MNKHGLVVFVCFILYLLSTPLALASGDAIFPTTKPYFGGFYIGAGAGLAMTAADIKSSSSAEITSDSMDGQGGHELDLGKFAFNGNIFVGIGKVFKSSYYLGLELFGNYFNKNNVNGNYDYLVHDKKEDKQYDINVKTGVENSDSYGGMLRVGYLVKPRAMIYVLFGVDYALWHIKNHLSIQQDSIPSISEESNKGELGWMPGIGAELGLTNHLSLRLEYSYVFYDSFSQSFTKEGDIPDKIFPKVLHHYKVNVKDEIDPSRSLFTLKLSYLFN